jgi:glycosyltransferase involved in cell wall biosynthesis
MSGILLSVLIPSLPERLPKLAELLACLEAQADPRMEVIVLTDNRSRHLGTKRNLMMQMAQGAYLCHIDDDEILAPDFFATLVPELIHGVDLVAYDAGVSLNGSPEFRVRTILGAACEQPSHLPGGRYSDIVRPPWHWCLWRSDFARRFKFPDHHDGAEDWFWLRQALPAVQTHRKVDRVLFHHRFDERSSTFSTTRHAP